MLQNDIKKQLKNGKINSKNDKNEYIRDKTKSNKEEKINEDKQVTFLYRTKEVIRIKKLIKVEQIEISYQTRISNI